MARLADKNVCPTMPLALSRNQWARHSCLADAKGMTCKECGLCDGNRRTAMRGKPLPHVFITAHGYQKQKAISASGGNL